MSPTTDAGLIVRLSNLESYISGLSFPELATGNIYPTSVPASLLFAEMELFVFVPDAEGTILDFCPLLMFRTREAWTPQPGEMKEIRLLGLYQSDRKITLNTYVRGTATIMPAS